MRVQFSLTCWPIYIKRWCGELLSSFNGDRCIVAEIISIMYNYVWIVFSESYRMRIKWSDGILISTINWNRDVSAYSICMYGGYVTFENSTVMIKIFPFSTFPINNLMAKLWCSWPRKQRIQMVFEDSWNSTMDRGYSNMPIHELQFG